MKKLLICIVISLPYHVHAMADDDWTKEEIYGVYKSAVETQDFPTLGEMVNNEKLMSQIEASKEKALYDLLCSPDKSDLTPEENHNLFVGLIRSGNISGAKLLFKNKEHFTHNLTPEQIYHLLRSATEADDLATVQEVLKTKKSALIPFEQQAESSLYSLAIKHDRTTIADYLRKELDFVREKDIFELFRQAIATNSFPTVKKIMEEHEDALLTWEEQTEPSSHDLAQQL